MWKALLYRLKAISINPERTSHSENHRYIMGSYKLNRHTASVYLLALKARRVLKNLQRPRKIYK